MSIHRTHCYTLVCDDCATVADDDTDGYILHFDSDHASLDYAAANGWTITEDGHVRCPRCTAATTCAQIGHDDGDWIPCGCEGHIPEHAEHGCGMVHICAQCDRREHTAFADIPTTDEPVTES
ncbi:hypothetical protein Psed_5230 [Pseudonocardia dioxanivorans CB1190]|uniref:Uncharacterized protein n=1 Tax=Pseudonocardia dioxanivorans (strain ATCC 55486 / DSM 44775 / JCM 13855 / CB1190) TaxID=675635 RepID=F4CTE1_PSEUX|nr:hypothetical protein [Pseudonocardia dioxanivorans]AEA27366.1 hypothetical protein Psed_5230 [Pseudonocardia dioxanivorans CB1190]